MGQLHPHRPTHRVISGGARATLLSVAGNPPLHAELRYRTTDPYAVQLVLSLDQSPAVSWEFARDLVITGAFMPAGLGDVRLHPSEDGIVLELHGVSSRAVVLLDRDDVLAFLGRCLGAVPSGQENSFYDLTDELTLLSVLPVNEPISDPSLEL